MIENWVFEGIFYFYSKLIILDRRNYKNNDFYEYEIIIVVFNKVSFLVISSFF